MDNELNGDESLVIQFKAVMRLLLNLLEHGDVDRAIEEIKKILEDE